LSQDTTNAHLRCILWLKEDGMRPPFKVGPLVAAVVILVACGSNNSMIRVSPAVADARDYPGGVVSFTASGACNPTWCMGTMNAVCSGNIASPAVIGFHWPTAVYSGPERNRYGACRNRG
jgi:hypothetical protein